MQHLKDIIRVKNEEPLWAWTKKRDRKEEKGKKRKEKKTKYKTAKNKIK